MAHLAAVSIERQYRRIATRGGSLGGRRFVETTWVTRAERKTLLAFIRGHQFGPQRVLAHSKQLTDLRLSDFFPGLVGPSGIRNQFDSLLIPARQALASQEIRVCDWPQRGMESTHRARDRPLISHNSSDIAARTGRGSRGRMRDLGSCFIHRGVWSDDFLLRSNVPFFDLRTPWQPARPCSSSSFSFVSAYPKECFIP